MERRCQKSNLILYIKDFIKELKENRENLNIIEIEHILKCA